MEIQAQEQRKSTCTRPFSGKGLFGPVKMFTSAVRADRNPRNPLDTGERTFPINRPEETRQPLLQHDLCPTDICHLPLSATPP